MLRPCDVPMFVLAGLCALSTNHANSYLAYPGSATIGEIIVYDANNLVMDFFTVLFPTHWFKSHCYNNTQKCPLDY